MSLSRKHFNELAEIIRVSGLGMPDHIELARRMASFCAQHNPRFDYDRFMAACGVEA